MLSIRYHAHHLELTGYGRAAAGYLGAIERVNDGSIEIDVVPVERHHTVAPVDVAVYHTTPGRLAKIERGPARRHVVVTTWETDPLPLEHAETLSAFDAVIVPSAFCKQLVKLPNADDEHTLRCLTRVIPHAFDPDVWTPREGPRLPSDIVTFYSIGTWGERKNTLGLLKAYLHAFKKSDRTRLVLVVDKANLMAIQSLLARSMIPREELPGLVVPDHRLSDEELLSLHRDGDCFVTATRSEGFGLPIFEAAVMGKPVIAPSWGGHTEFLKDYPQWRRIWYAMTPVFPGEDEAVVEGNALRVSLTLPAGANARQLWAEPSLDRLALEMRMVAQDFREGRLHDRHDRRDWFEKNYGFDEIGATLVNTLKETLR